MQQGECRENICVQVELLPREELMRRQRKNVEKLQAIHNADKGLVGSAALLRKYSDTNLSADNQQSNKVDFLVTITSAVPDSAVGREYFEIAHDIETGIMEQAYFTTDRGAKFAPAVVRLYEVHPLQHTWQVLITINDNPEASADYVFHWNDTAFKTGIYSIAVEN